MDFSGEGRVLHQPASVDELESFLETLRPEVESEGSFTVAFDKARHKMEKYQLEDPWQFPLELLAVSVLGGGDEFRVQSKPNEVLVAFQGKAFGRECLENIKDHSYTASLSRRHQRLAVALNALQALEPELIEFQSGEAPDAHTWAFRRGKETVAPSSGNLLVGYSNVLRVQLYSTWSLQASSRPARDLSGVLERAHYAPLRLYYNGQVLNPENERLGAAWEISHPEVALNKRWTGVGRLHDLNSEAFEDLPSFSAILFVADPGDCEFGLRVILDGVSFTADRKLLGNPYLHCLVAAPSLSTDLSHTNLVVNAEFLRLMNHLKDLGHRGTLSLTQSLSQERLPSFWSSLVEATLEHFQEVKDEEASQFLDNWLTDRRRLRASRLAKERERAARRMREREERELQAKISDPRLNDIRTAKWLEKSGRGKDAAKLRRNLALSASRKLLRMERKTALAYANKLKANLGDYQLSEGWSVALEYYATEQVELTDYQEALAQGDVATAVSLLRESDQSDVLAACLELLPEQASRREALLLRLRALEKNSTNTFLRYLRLETIRLRSRGVVSFVHGVKLSLRASWAYHVASMGGINTCLSPALTRAVLGLGPPQYSLESELLDLRESRLIDEDTRVFCETGFLFSYRKFSMYDEATALDSRLYSQNQLPLLRARLQTELAKLKAKA